MTHPPVEEQPTAKKGAIDRSHQASVLPKLGFFLLHLGSIVLCVYMVWGSGCRRWAGGLDRPGS